MPSRILFLDTEAKIKVCVNREEHHTVKLGWTCYCRRTSGNKWKDHWVFHKSGQDLCRYISSLAHSRSPLWIFAHNIGYDLRCMGFYKHFTKAGWLRVFNYDKGDTYILIITKDHASIKLVSTTNYFKGSLEDLGESINLPKIDVDFYTASFKELSDHCRRDVEILKAFIFDYFHYVQSNDLGQFRLTRGSQSFTAFRHKFMSKRIYLHRIPGVLALERASYMGGRVECFRIGRQTEVPYLSLDINSMYPYLMHKLKLPSKLADYQENYSINSLATDLKHFSAIAEVTLTPDFPYYAYRHNNKILFPVGEFTAYLCSEGLKKAIELNHLIDIKKVAIYRQAHLFKEFVEYFYKQRLEYAEKDDHIHQRFCKTLMNSLYGKFGQKITIQNEFPYLGESTYKRLLNIDLLTGKRDMEYILFNKRIVEVGKEEGKHSFCAIASHITEAGRILLAEIIAQIGLGTVVYCDTDSIIIPEKALSKVTYPIHPNLLGNLKKERIYESLDIIAPKAYITNQGRKIKGIPKRAVETSKRRFEFMRFEGEKTHMLNEITDYQLLRPAFRELSGEYTKGIINEDGTISPFSLSLS